MDYPPNVQGTVMSYVPACGNVHFPPNARDHYDDESPHTVMSTCKHFALRDGPGGSDAAEPFSMADFVPYNPVHGEDCEGGWQVWWRQSMPGFQNPAIDQDGNPMKNWWPFLFY